MKTVILCNHFLNKFQFFKFILEAWVGDALISFPRLGFDFSFTVWGSLSTWLISEPSYSSSLLANSLNLEIKREGNSTQLVQLLMYK